MRGRQDTQTAASDALEVNSNLGAAAEGAAAAAGAGAAVAAAALGTKTGASLFNFNIASKTEFQKKPLCFVGGARVGMVIKCMLSADLRDW